MNDLLLSHDRMVDWLLSQVPNHPESGFQTRTVSLRVNPSANHLETSEVIDEHPLSGLGLFMVVGQVTKAAHCWLEEFVIAAVNIDNSEKLSYAVGVADGKFEWFVVHGQVGDDAGSTNYYRNFGVVQKFDKLASKMT